MAVIFTLSSMPKLPEPPGLLADRDKLQHLIAYSVLGALALRSLAYKQRPLATVAVGAFLLSVAFGATDEWHQRFVPGRNCDIWDWLFDAAGSAVGIAAYLVYNRAKGGTRLT